MFTKLILLTALGFPPSSLREAESRYGPLNYNYELENKKEWIVKFDTKKLFNLDLGQTLWVNKDMVLPLFLVLSDLEMRGLLSEITTTHGCFASRPVRGEAYPSTHAYGLACDFDHKPHRPEVVKVFKQYGFCWGGDWDKKDYMHFSYAWEC